MSVNAQDLVDECFAKFAAPAILSDPTRRLIAFSVQPEDVIDAVRRQGLMNREYLSTFDWLISQVRPGQTLLRVAADPGRGLAPRTVIPLYARRIAVGYLIAVDPEERITEADVERWQPILSAVALEIEFERAESVRRRTVVSALLSSDEDDRHQAADTVLETYSLDNRRAIRVVVARIARGTDASISDAHWDLTAGTRGIVTSIEHNLVAILVDQQTVVTAFCDQMVKVGTFAGHSPRGGVGGSILGLDQAYRSYRQAKRTLTLASLDLCSEQVLHWDRLGSWRALLTIRPEDAVDAVDPRILGLLRAEDTATVATVRRYLECDGDIGSLAADLHIHRTTIYGRLKRLANTYAIDWNNTEDRAAALIGIRIAALHQLDGPVAQIGGRI